MNICSQPLTYTNLWDAVLGQEFLFQEFRDKTADRHQNQPTKQYDFSS